VTIEGGRCNYAVATSSSCGADTRVLDGAAIFCMRVYVLLIESLMSECMAESLRYSAVCIRHGWLVHLHALLVGTTQSSSSSSSSAA